MATGHMLHSELSPHSAKQLIYGQSDSSSVVMSSQLAIPRALLPEAESTEAGGRVLPTLADVLVVNCSGASMLEIKKQAAEAALPTGSSTVKEEEEHSQQSAEVWWACPW